MVDLGILGDLTFAFAGALVGGFAFQRWGLPPLPGYLLGGVLVGPSGLGLIADLDRVLTLAEIGVIFLMFSLGVELSLRELLDVGRVATLGGALQVVGTALLGTLVGSWIGLAPALALFLGGLLVFSSTTVVLKTLEDRGELASTHGRVAVGTSLFEDLLLIPAVVLVSTVAVPAPLAAEALLAAAARTAAIAAATYVAASLIPHVLFTVAASRYRELFVLAVVALVLALAVGAQQLGLSLALAAFLAGLAVSESELAHQILAEVLPVRDVFSVLFFASLGMLLDPRFVADHVGPIAAILAVVVLAKAGLVLGVVRLFGYSFRTALLAGVGLAQIGEFSFVLARAGLDQGLVPPDLVSLTVAVALISMLTTPFAFRLGDTLLRAAAGWPWLQPLVQPEPREGPPAGVEAMRGHAVVCGAGEVGRAIVLALRARGFPVVAVDNDPQRAAELRREGVPVVYGDAGNPHVLAHANLGSARVLALAVPDPVAAEAAVRAARRLNPDVDIIARVSHDEAAHLLREPGVDEVVHPKLEAGLEMLRHVLERFGVPPSDALAEVQWRRAMHYRKEWPGHGRP